MCKIIRGQSCGLSVKRMNVVPPNSANFSGENILDKGRGTHLAEKIRETVFEGLPSSQQGIVQFSFFWRQTGLPGFNFIRNKISKTAQMLKHDNLKSASLDYFFCILILSDLKISSVFSSDCSAKMFK